MNTCTISGIASAVHGHPDEHSGFILWFNLAVDLPRKMRRRTEGGTVSILYQGTRAADLAEELRDGDTAIVVGLIRPDTSRGIVIIAREVIAIEAEDQEKSTSD